MASPFPGMDPFLEKPSRWQSVHQRYITYLADAINPLLPENYVADIGERIYVTTPPKEMYPDVYVLKHPKKKERNGRAASSVLVADPPFEIEFPPTEIREVFVEIRLTDGSEKLVTMIEFLSPTNKTAGDGRNLYLEKQRELLSSTTHLIEVDFLRAGQHTVAAPRDQLPMTGWEYLVCLHRGGWRNKFHCWPIALQKHLPRITIPLAGSDADVVVDLQSILNQCYKSGRFAERLDYRAECPPPLSKKNAKWIDELLRKRKLRK
jgi:hypothetical protein